MGEYVWTSYRIGGKLPRAKLDEFNKLIKDFDSSASDDPEKSCEGSVHFGGIMKDGNYQDLDDFLVENGLSFHAHWSAAPGSFDSGLRWWAPGMEAPEEDDASDDGDPIASMEWLLREFKAGKTIDDIIAVMLPQSAEAVPNFEIVD